MSQSLEPMLDARLEQTKIERQNIKEALDILKVKIESKTSKIGQRPRETEQEIDAMLAKLEYDHSRTSSSREEERDFMRSIDKLKKKKKSLLEFITQQEELDQLRNRRSALIDELREKEKALDDLHQGLKKLRVARKINCHTSEIIEQTFKVPEEKLSRIIGKGGSSLLQTEERCGVSIETDKTGGGIRILGSQATINSAWALISNIVNSTTEEISPSEETLVCLTLGKATLCQQYQQMYDVRLDVSRGTGLCKISGLRESIDAVKVAISGIDSLRIDIPVDATVTPAIIGKGGANIRALESTHNVVLNIPKDNQVLSILGYAADVRQAANALFDLIEDKREFEERIQLDKSTMLTCIAGPGGQNIRALQNELDVNLTIDRDPSGNAGESGVTGTYGAIQTLIVKGNATKLAAAMRHIHTLVDAFHSDTIFVPVTLECIPVIFGRGGSRIKQIRSDFPNVSIDLDEPTATFRVHSSNTEAKEKVAKLITDIIEANVIEKVSMSSDVSITLKGKRGEETRNLIRDTLNLNMDINTEQETIVLRGSRESLDKGIRALTEFSETNAIVEVSVADEDMSSLLDTGVTGSGQASLAKSIEAEFSVELFVVRKQNIVRIVGHKDAILEASAKLSGVLEGSNLGESQMISIEQYFFPTLIGKGGATIKRFETTHGVKFDLLGSRDCLRIRGDAAAVNTAKVDVLRYLDSSRSSAKINVKWTSPDGTEVLDEDKTTKLSRKVSSIFAVDVDTKECNVINVRGRVDALECAKKFILHESTGKAALPLTLENKHVDFLATLAGDGGPLSKISAEFGVLAEVVRKPVAKIVFRGAVEAAHRVKKSVHGLLQKLFPREYIAVPAEATVLQDLGSLESVAAFESTGCTICVDYELGCLRIMGNAGEVQAVTTQISEKNTRLSDLRIAIPIEANLIPSFVGKGGVGIQAIETDSGTRITVSRDELLVHIVSKNQESKLKAEQLVTEKLEQIRNQYWEYSVPDDVIGALLGKGGEVAKKMRSETSANIEIDTKTLMIKVTGAEESVAAAKACILNFLQDHQAENGTQRMSVFVDYIPIVIGKGGAVIRELQEKSGAKIEVQRDSKCLLFRGREEKRTAAIDAVNALLAENGLEPLFTYVPPKPVAAPMVEKLTAVTAEATKAVYSRAPVGAPPELLAAMSGPNLSVSALKRLRRKERKMQEQEQLLEEEEEEEEKQAASSVTTAPTNSNTVVSPAIVSKPSVLPDVPVTVLSSKVAMKADKQPVITANGTHTSASHSPVPVPVPVPVHVPVHVSVPVSLAPASATVLVPARIPVHAPTLALAPTPAQKQPTEALRLSTENGNYFKSKSGLKVRL